MEKTYWQQRWEESNLAWHRTDYHPALLKYWPKLVKRAKVLVPFCGKSHDLIYLAEQGLQVYGSELSQLAAEQFFSEHGLNYHSHYQGDFQHYQCVELSIHIIVGDFFALTAEEFSFDVSKKGFDAVYDRAALVALPEIMRDSYVTQCLTLLKDDYQGLLITFEYDQSQMQGPPFSIAQEEVKHRYSDQFKRKESFDLLVDGSPFNEQGFEFFNEISWIK